MTGSAIARIPRLLNEAEGYLMLNLPEKALKILQSRDDWGIMPFEANLLTGKALCQLERYDEAIKLLELAAKLKHDSLDVAMELGWCYKRNHQLAEAIDALQRIAPRHGARYPVLHYNLACYWSLAGKPELALRELDTALERNPDYIKLIDEETDFDPIREHPGFQKLVKSYSPETPDQ